MLWTVVLVGVAIAGLDLLSPFLTGKLIQNSSLSDSSSAIEVVSSHKVLENSSISVVGEIINKGDRSPEFGFSVEVSFYDKSNKLMDVGKDFLSGKFPSGTTRPFKVTFGCAKHPVHGDYDHYMVKVR